MTALAGWALAHVALPLGLVAWLALAPPRDGAGLAALALAGLAVLAALRLAGAWLWLPWWSPGAYVLLWLGALGLALRAGWPAAPWPGSAGGWAALGLALALAGLGLWTVGTALAGRHLPAGAQPVQIPLPLEPGRYRVVHGGSRPLINRHLLVRDPSRPLHAAYRGQAHAVDIVATGRWGLPGRGARPQPRDPRAHAIFGARVLAPCAGRVVQARGDRPDMPVPQPDRSLLEGNHVLLDCGGGVWLLLAHLAQGSVGVAAGERVAQGAPLGRVGNSGNSTLPHLHLHAQTPGTADRPLSGDPLWLTIDGRLPVRGMRLTGG